MPPPSGSRPLDRPGEIAGWLLLPAIGLIAAVARDTFAFLKVLVGFFKAFGHGLETISRVHAALFNVALVGAFLAFDAAVAAFFFGKHRWAPRACILFLLSRLTVAGLYLLMRYQDPRAAGPGGNSRFTRSRPSWGSRTSWSPAG